MAIPKFEEDLDIIGKLGTIPSVDDGLSEAAFKAKFDEGSKKIAKFLNEKLIDPLNALVDVQSLLNNILDTTLSKSDKAANAKSTGTALSQKLSLSGGSMSGVLDMNGRAITNLATPTSNGSAANKEYVDSKHLSVNVIATAAGWTGEGPYTQSINVPGLLNADKPHIGVLYSDSAEVEESEVEAASYLRKVIATENTLTITCADGKPEVDLNLLLEVNR